jgi:hypothetical protein
MPAAPEDNIVARPQQKHAASTKINGGLRAINDWYHFAYDLAPRWGAHISVNESRTNSARPPYVPIPALA